MMTVLTYTAGCGETAPALRADARDAGEHAPMDGGRPGRDASVPDAVSDDGSAPPSFACTPEGPRVVDEFPTYGGYRPEDPLGSTGLALPLSERWIVFADRPRPHQQGTRLSLVEVVENRLVRRHTVTSTLAFDVRVGGGLNWSAWPHGVLIPLERERFVFVASKSGAEVYAIDTGRLVRTHHRPFSPNGPSFVSGVAIGDALWLCGSAFPPTQDFGFRITARGIIPVNVPDGVPLSACRDMALSTSGRRLVIGRRSGLGIERFALDGSTPRPEGVVSENRAFARVTAGSRFFAGLEIQGAGAPGDIFVYELATGRLVARLASRDRGGALPTGVALTEEDLLLVTWLRYQDGWFEELEVHRLDSTGSELLASEELSTTPRAYTPPFVDLATAGRLAVVSARRDVWRIDPGAPPRELTGPGHGGLFRFARIGPHRGIALGTRVAAEIDVGEEGIRLLDPRPLAPAVSDTRIVRGGRGSSWVLPRPRLTEAFDDTAQPREQIALDIVDWRPAGSVAARSTTLGWGPARLAGMGDGLVQLDAVKTLRAWQFPPDAMSQPELAAEARLEPPMWPGYDADERFAPLIAPDAGEVVVLTSMVGQASNRDRRGTYLQWVDLLGRADVSTLFLEDQVTAARAHAGRGVLFLGSRGFAVVARGDEGRIEELARVEHGSGVTPVLRARPLWWDGTSVGLNATAPSRAEEPNGSPRRGPVLVEYAGEAWSRSQVLPVDSEVLDVLELRGWRVLATQVGLVWVTRPCL